MSLYNTRTGLARVVLEKIENDNCLHQIDRNDWYSLDSTALPYHISNRFIQFHEDNETSKFLVDSEEKSNWVITQLFHSFMLTVCKYFMSITSVNGLLQRGSMFVFSHDQFKVLMDFDDETKLSNLLDLGAGDGAVTDKMAKYFKQTYVTEMSSTMQWRLKHKGFNVLDVNSWHSTIEDNEHLLKFDMISCLNLLDRCDKPLTLLQTIKKALKPNGYLLVALVLPLKPYVEYNKGNKPTETFPFKLDKNLAEQISELTDKVFAPIGFELVRFSKLPYLCEGNLAQSYYYLIDYLFVLKNIEPNGVQ